MSSPEGGIEELPLLRDTARSSRVSRSFSSASSPSCAAICSRRPVTSASRAASCSRSCAISSSRTAHGVQPGAGGGISDTRDDHARPTPSSQLATDCRLSVSARPWPTSLAASAIRLPGDRGECLRMCAGLYFCPSARRPYFRSYRNRNKDPYASTRLSNARRYPRCINRLFASLFIYE